MTDAAALYAEQPALDGLAKHSRKPRTARQVEAQIKAELRPAQQLPIVRVALDVQAPHLGQLFDYYVPEKLSREAQPGRLVRVRFGNRRCSGIIWERVDSSRTSVAALKPLERVLGMYAQLDAHMRVQIERIAQYFGGSIANVIRLAVPPRVAKVEQDIDAIERSHGDVDTLDAQVIDHAKNGFAQLDMQYTHMSDVAHALTVTGAPEHIVWDCLPGASQWSRDIAWLVARARSLHRQVVIIVPGTRRISDIAEALSHIGMDSFHRDDTTGKWTGNFVYLTAAQSAADRYRSYLAIARGLVGCVIGTRAAMYAPVTPGSVYITFHDTVYQNWDGFTPYPNVRDVVRLRAYRSNGLVVSMGYVRSQENQWQLNHHSAAMIEVHGSHSAISTQLPWIRHLDRAELNRLEDPTIGARVPSTAVRVLREAAEKGPVLLSIPARSQAAVECCAQCRKIARCRRCLGPLMPRKVDGHMGRGLSVCQWCSTVATDWKCQHCGSTKMRLLHVGTEGTAQELATLIPRVPVIISTPTQPRGVVEDIESKPALVIATPGSEPRVRDPRNGHDVGYESVAIVDAWTSLYGSSLDQRIDTMMNWGSVVALAKPHDEGGQALIIGEAEKTVVQALTLWKPKFLAQQEVLDAAETGLPPYVAAALVWGERSSVEQAIRDVTTDFGGLETVMTTMGELPAVLGPVPKALSATVRQQYIDGLYERVQCIIRVTRENRGKLVSSLHCSLARHSAQRNAPELHFHINPKTLL
ncbi:hypothetical protein ACFQY8_06040 [Alloscardovia venturai]|uniref:Primosomal protein N' 3' DNA-binding domain-containing protein n=1 Tax=Alloscardovia venturai TaxID=1769421 RepID=A0ABW2YB06_9BIFI